MIRDTLISIHGLLIFMTFAVLRFCGLLCEVRSSQLKVRPSIGPGFALPGGSRYPGH